MTVNIPDYGPLRLPNRLEVEAARRQLVGLGFTQVEGATATVAANGDITFARNTGGAKAL